MWSGKLYADSDVNFKDLGSWIPGQWYNLRIEIDHVAEKTIKYYLNNQLVHTSPLGSKVMRANDLNFEFDNDGSGFIVDNIIIRDMDQMAVSDVSRSQISIYPNPAAEFLNIRTDDKIKSVRIYSTTGNLVKTENNHLSILNIASLPKGNYMVTIETDKGSETKKIIKE